MTVSKAFRNGVHAVCKIVAGIAICVFLFANPVGDKSGIAFIISIFVLLVCGGVAALVEYLSVETEPMPKPPTGPTPSSFRDN